MRKQILVEVLLQKLLGMDDLILSNVSLKPVNVISIYKMMAEGQLFIKVHGENMEVDLDRKPAFIRKTHHKSQSIYFKEELK